MNTLALESFAVLESPRPRLEVLPRVATPEPALRLRSATRAFTVGRPVTVETPAPRRVMLPPSDCAYWHAPAELDSPLRYLSWGARKYGLSPITEARHEGWVYALVESGSPTLVHQGVQEKIEAPTLVLIGPDCTFGWRDEMGAASKLLVWMWREPVHGAFRQLRRDSLIRYTLDAGEQDDLRRLHTMSRDEVHRSDTHSVPALAAVQALLETRIVRLSEGVRGSVRDEMVDRALDWVGAHLATRQPLARLADFLAVSPATVQRLFRENLGTTVMKTIADLRRREAERLLASKGVSVKEVAYRLGYRHPHDFSRAFRKSSGRLPSQLEAKSA